MQATPPIVVPDPPPGATRPAVIVPGVYVCEARLRGGRILRILSCDYVPLRERASYNRAGRR